ncbi:hypothetical protein ABDF71_24740 [Ochrobactrum sp. WV_118_8]
MNLTAHASARMQQRAFPRHVVEAIVQYGAGQIVRGAESIMLDRRALRMAAEVDNRLAIELERYRGSYVIVGDSGQIVTVARRKRRLKH